MLIADGAIVREMLSIIAYYHLVLLPVLELPPPSTGFHWWGDGKALIPM